MKHTAADHWLSSISGAKDDLLKKLVDDVKQRDKDAEGSMSKYQRQRELAQKCMENDFTWRRTGDEEDIWNKRNETMGLVRSGIAFIVARTQEDVFGSTPYFASMPVGIDDEQLADRIQKHAEYKMAEAGYDDKGEKSIERVFNFGEAIHYTGWKRNVVKYQRVASFLCSGPDDKPVQVLAADGEPIEEGEIEAVMAEEEKTGGLGEGETGRGGEEEMGEAATEVVMMVRGEAFEMQEGYRFCELLVDAEDVLFDGLEITDVDWKDFRCAVNYDSIEDAPYRGHYCQMRLSEIIRLLESMHEKPLSAMEQSVQDMVAKLQSGQSQNTESHKENAAPDDSRNPTVKCLRFEVEFDPLDNGDTRWLTGILFPDCDELLFVEFIALVAPGRASLYTTISAYNLPNTWVGRGWWEIYSDLTANADRIWNNLLFRAEQNCNPITGVNEDAFDEDLETKRIVPGARFRLKQDKNISDGLSTFVVPNADRAEWELLQFFMKLNQLETGVTSSAQGGLGDLPATNTATGIQSVLASGSTLHKRPAKDIKQGFEHELETLLAVLYSRHDKDETVAVGDGENVELVTLTRMDVLKLKLNVRMTMTRGRQREMVESAQAAIDALVRYLALPEPEKAAARPMFLQLLKGLGIEGANRILRLPLEATENDGMSELLAVVKPSYTDLPVEVQAQLLARLGFEDVTPEMLARRKEEEIGRGGDAETGRRGDAEKRRAA